MNWGLALLVGAIVGGLLGSVTASITITRTREKKAKDDET